MSEQLNKKACIYFHQGWTDIIMCLGLIAYYKNLYDEIFVIIRSDAKDLVDFYVRDKNDINIIYISTDNGRFYGGINTESDIDTISYDGSIIQISKKLDIMFHGEHDRFRRDKYYGYWYRPESFKKRANHFSEMFYIFYDIDFNVRINDFIVGRDYQLEEEKYQEFIQKYGEKYIIFHDDETNHQHGLHHVSTKIHFDKKNDSCVYVNINKQSNVFFDYIKILQEAEEIHLIDSVWACLIYQLDAKYGVLNGKKITIYCKRSHQNLFLNPIKLENWIIK